MYFVLFTIYGRLNDSATKCHDSGLGTDMHALRSAVVYLSSTCQRADVIQRVQEREGHPHKVPTKPARISPLVSRVNPKQAYLLITMEPLLPV